MLKVALAKLLTVKVAVAAAAVTAVSGAALAATGTLPNPLEVPNPAGPSTPGSAENRGGTPDPSLYGLCQAYVGGATSNEGKALESPAFEALVNAAGGADKLDAYCDDVLADSPGGGPPAGTPGGPPDSVPTDPPADVPADGGRPTGVPSGPPTDVPTPPSHS